MRNIIGPLNDNIICKYDLKGSTFQRETKLDVENIGEIVLKDNNFEDIEHYLFMDKSEINRLRRNIISDGYFLGDMELMDYSLFLVKVSLNKEEIKEIFEDEVINQYWEKNKNLNENERRESMNNYANTENCIELTESLKINFLENEIDCDQNKNKIKNNTDLEGNQENHVIKYFLKLL